jgi:hypothetical protein
MLPKYDIRLPTHAAAKDETKHVIHSFAMTRKDSFLLSRLLFCHGVGSTTDERTREMRSECVSSRSHINIAKKNGV